MSPRPARAGPLLAAAGVGATVLAYGLVFHAPGLLFADAGELLAAAALSGVPHPPGFPVYLLLSGPFLAALGRLGVAPAPALSLFSVVSGSMAASLAVAVAVRPVALAAPGLGGRALLAIAAAAGLLAGAGPTLLGFTLGIEVYALHTAFVAGAIASALAADAAEDPSSRRRATLLSGLAVGGGLGVHHATMIVVLPGLAVLLWGDEPARARVRRGLAFAAALLPGLLSYAVLPLRARALPPLAWGDPTSPGRFWAHVTAKVYQVNLGASPSEIAAHAGRFLSDWRAELSAPGILLAAAGLAAVAVARRRVALGLGLVLSADVAFALQYEIAEDQAAYYLPAFLVSSVLAAAGAAALLEQVRRRWPGRATSLAGGLLAACLAAQVVPSAVATSARGSDRRADEATDNLFAALPVGSLALTPEWNLFAPAWARQLVSGERRDVVLIDVLLLKRSWYLDSVARAYPERIAEVRPAFDRFRARLVDWEEGRPYDGDELTGLYEGLTRALVTAAFGRGAPCAWVGRPMPSHLPKGSVLVPTGFLQRVVPRGAPVDLPVVPPSIAEASRRDLGFDYGFETAVRPHYVQALVEAAGAALARGRPEEAARLAGVALGLDPWQALALETLGDAAARTGDTDGALSRYAAALEAGGDGARLAAKSRALGAGARSR